jgi:hypothetical protein
MHIPVRKCLMRRADRVHEHGQLQLCKFLPTGLYLVCSNALLPSTESNKLKLRSKQAANYEMEPTASCASGGKSVHVPARCSPLFAHINEPRIRSPTASVMASQALDLESEVQTINVYYAFITVLHLLTRGACPEQSLVRIQPHTMYFPFHSPLIPHANLY